MKNERNRDVSLLILLCVAVYSAAYVGRYSYTSSMVGIMEETGAAKDAAGLVSTAFYLPYGCGQLVNAFFCRRYKPRPTVAGILLLSMLANIAAALLREPSAIRWAWFVNGAAQSALWCTLLELLSRKTPPQRKGRAIFAMSATLTIGTTTAYSISALSIAAGHVFFTFWAAAAILAAAAAAWWILTGRLLRRMPDAGAKAEDGAAPLSQKAILTGALGAILSCGVLAIGVGFLRDTLVNWTPSLLFERFGLPESASVMITLILPLISVGGALVAVGLHKKIPSYTGMIGCLYAVSAAAFGGLFFFFRAEGVVGVILCAALNACVLSGINSTITSMIPLERAQGAGLFAGIMDAFCYVGSTLSGFLPGYLLERYGYGTLLTVLPLCAAALVIFSAAAVFADRRKKRAAGEEK